MLLLNDLLLLSHLKLVQLLRLAKTCRLTHGVVQGIAVLQELRLNLVIVLLVENIGQVLLLDSVQVRVKIHQLLYCSLRMLLIVHEVSQRRVWLKILELQIRRRLIEEWLLLILHLLILRLLILERN